MEGDHEFRWVEPAAGFKVAPEEFEEKPALASDFLKKSNADAFLTGRIAKGPQGLSIRLVLFAGKDGLPLGVESRTEIKNFEIEDLKRELAQTYRQLKNKIPYRGFLLSRRGSEVTINLGQSSGLKNGQEVYAVQLTRVQRHPRFGFLINTEKEIMGKIRITKVEEALSFGTITSERTDGLLKPGFKINFEEFVSYQSPQDAEDIAFGKNPKEWLPPTPPSFGKVGLLLGFGNYSLSTNLASSGGLSARNSLVPSFHVEGEMWLSAHWFLGLEMHQYVSKVDNPLSGASPGQLDLQTLETELVGGYNVLVAEEFWGPKLQVMFGISQMDSKIEDSSPTAFTSMKYGGTAFGLAGTIPMGGESGLPLTFGGKFMYYWSPTLSEAPIDSGSSSSNKISTFSIFGEYQAKERLAYRGEISFRQYNSNFSGSGTGSRATDPATSASHSMTTLAGGVVFLF